MEDLLKQIKIALDNNLYLIALQATLTLPDICAALSSRNGKTKGDKYIKWYDENVTIKQQLSGNDCYYFRCAMLHQGKMQHKDISYSRVIFLEPYTTSIVLSGNIMSCGNEKAVTIDLLSFCNEIITCVYTWWNQNKNNDIVKNNYSKMVKCYPNGLPPFIVGAPLIA